MSGPYFDGIGAKKRRRNETTSSDSDENSSFFSSSDHEGSVGRQKRCRKRRVTQLDAEVIPTFRPDEKSSNVKGWLHKIDQLGDVYGWSNKDRQFIMQIRLRDSARDWYDDLEDYDLTWMEWKNALETAFPRSTDFADLLEVMLARKKTDSETMTKYFHDKVSLLKKCKIDGESAISCIIRGLPAELRANAKAFQCETPQQLYYGYLSSLENYKQVEEKLSKQPTTTWRRGGYSTSARGPDLLKKCYACRREGHEAKDCRVPRCEVCRRPGHTAASCWYAVGSSHQQLQEVSNVLFTTYNIYLDLYKKAVVINGHSLTAYIDTGSKLNILSVNKANQLNLKIMPSVVTMKGFGGAYLTSLGTTYINVYIDNITISGYVELTNYDLTGVDLIIGQTMINQPNVSLIISQNFVSFVDNLTYEHSSLCDVQLYERDFVTKFPVYLKSCSIIPRRSSVFVKVYLDNDTNESFLVKSVYYELGSTSYVILGGLIGSKDCLLKIINTGDNDIKWQANRLIARAEVVSNKYNSFNSIENIMTVDQSNVSELKSCDIDVGDLDNSDRDRLLQLLNKYKHLFAKSTKDLGCTDVLEMHIRTQNEQPVYCKPYRLSHKENEIVNEKVQDLIDAGIVRDSVSDYASPVVLVRKKGGDYRLCIDYRALNARTIKDRYPLPHIDDQVSRLSGKSLFTTLDLAQGYYQIKLSKDSIHKTAFVTPSGHYEFLKMPFGLANAPAVFSRLIKIVLGSLGENIATYLDDVMLPTTSVDDGLKLLDNTLKLLSRANLKLNLSKCSFLKESVDYLGHEITAGTVRPGRAKITCVAEYKRPRNVHEVRQFIGLTSYFRKFIRGFAEIARPLTQLTKKDVEWTWGDIQETAFQTLKKRLIERPVLGIYDRNARTELHTDASKLGLGGILLQYQIDSVLKPIAYFSRVTTKEEQFYHSYELETLAVVESLKRFRIYLVGIPVKVVTDCAALRTTLVKKDLIPRIARWWLLIQDYDLQIEYRTCDRMRHVDALSRNPLQNCVLLIDESDWLVTLQLQDENVQSIITQLRNGTDNNNITANYTLKDDLLFRKTINGERFVIPKLAKWSLLQKFHDQIGHVGFDKCEKTIKAQFWFEGMTRFIRKYINSCLQCAYGKGDHGKLQGELHPIEKVASPMHTLHVDHLGPFVKTRKGNTYILVVIDSFTKFVFAKAVKNCSSVETIKHLKDIISQFGNPHRIITDRGKAFTSRYFKQFSEETQFKHILNAIASPRSNGQVERVNRTLINGLNTMSTSECTWDDHLNDIVWGINNTPHATTGFAPFKLLFGHCNSRLPAYPNGEPKDFESQSRALEERRNTAKFRIDKSMTLMKDRFDRSHKRCTKYSVGQLVLWKGGITRESTNVTRKLNGLYTGPYKVCKAEHSLDRYTICSIKGMKGYRKFSATVRGEVLRPYNSSIPDDSSSSDREVDRDDLIDLLES